MRNLRFIALLTITMFLILICIFQGGLAVSDTNERTYNYEVNIDTSTIWAARLGTTSYGYKVYEVNQGDKVFLGDHIDISRVAAGYQALAWFSSGYPSTSGTAYIIDLPTQNYKYYNVYLDPAVFKQYKGRWYKWDGYVEESGNQLAFEIVGQTRPEGMEVVQVINTTVIKQEEEKHLSELADKPIADYLVVHGQYTKIHSTQAPFKVWVFGTYDGVYDQYSEDPEFSLNKTIVQGLHSGKYKILLQYRGINNQFDVAYNDQKEELGRTAAGPWDKPVLKEIAGIQPLMVYDQVVSLLEQSDDKYETLSLEVQEPSLQIMEMDEVAVRDAKDYYKENPGSNGDLAALRGNVSVFRVQGYTNVNPGSGLKFYLDEDQQATPQAFTSHAVGNKSGSMRTFKVDIPVYWDGIKEGVHTISGYTEVGGSIFSDFNINIAPEHSYIPSEMVKWVGSEIPWKANMTTPTPVIVTQVVTQTILVNVTPPDEQVYAQQKAAQDAINAKNWQTVYTIAGIVIAGVILLIVGMYIYRIYRKAKEQRDYKRSLRKHEEDMLEYAEAISHEYGTASPDTMEWMR